MKELWKQIRNGWKCPKQKKKIQTHQSLQEICPFCWNVPPPEGSNYNMTNNITRKCSKTKMTQCSLAFLVRSKLPISKTSLFFTAFLNMFTLHFDGNLYVMDDYLVVLWWEGPPERRFTYFLPEIDNTKTLNCLFNNLKTSYFCGELKYYAGASKRTFGHFCWGLCYSCWRMCQYEHVFLCMLCILKIVICYHGCSVNV